ncbi:hypothetical protein CLF_111633 [Clonorchis sinensis]|uniref:Uncharacterized protein n=1 Tax=Clonorchis sinensis TaxID=79923 RepID=G7YLU3_CLOSI|nr:hypothetical protein CLF_111633 [Clonorchis sinensis]
MGSVQYQVAEDETCTTASSSSKRTTKHQKSKEDEDVDQEVEGPKEGEVATERTPKLSNAQSVDQLILERETSEGKKRTFYGAAVYQTSVFGRSSRSGSILASYNLSRRGSASMPEQISSAHFSGRLSEVGDELEESIQLLQRSSAAYRKRVPQKKVGIEKHWPGWLETDAGLNVTITIADTEDIILRDYKVQNANKASPNWVDNLVGL